ncbi:MAG TPA: DNA repair protein RecN, partial [Chloroflexi bacterium]|nr:DNA repair protein RecN [Chloroflexota bacterium]
MSRLLELSVRNFALVRDARLDCDPGFGALSGETGAGKSLCIAAVRWALGARVEGEAVGEGTSVR